MDHLPIKRALVSVTDKSGLVPFAKTLREGGVELVSTGGTKKALQDASLEVTSVSQVTGFPEILGGRVKTLHPHIHGGVLADKDNPEHLAVLADKAIAPFDLVCVNLYEFAKARAAGLSLAETVEQIDIGGPCLLRAAAKNFASVLVVPDVAFYERIAAELAANAFRVGLALRRETAAAAFKKTSQYDALIAEYLAG